MDTKKQRQCRHDVRLTKSGNARSKLLLVVPTESLTNRKWLLGGLLSGSECQRPGWFLHMKYQSCPNFIALPPLINVAYHNLLSDSTSFLVSHPWHAEYKLTPEGPVRIEQPNWWWYGIPDGIHKYIDE